MSCPYVATRRSGLGGFVSVVTSTRRRRSDVNPGRSTCFRSLPCSRETGSNVQGESPLERDERWMRRALDCAKVAFRNGEVPVGAVLVDENDCLCGMGRNRVEEFQFVGAHAEMECLKGEVFVVVTFDPRS
mmetsp:Transcript_15515/g.31393  ORF Transcript_15515/g.31393 Transcript_15515/m.31393 type:complete len:131 (-) Transcript_15515:1369-1761(-)